VTLVVSVLRGGKSFESPIGVPRCHWGDWMMILVFIILCSIILVIGIRRYKYIYSLKLRQEVKLCPSDVAPTK